MTEDARLRFSLKTMLAALTFGSLMLAAVVAFPNALATGALIVLLQIVPLALVAGILWGGQVQRVFCIGALPPAAVTLLTLAPFWILVLVRPYGPRSVSPNELLRVLADNDDGHRMIAVVSWAMSLLLGLVALGLRYWVFRR